ncbi:MAG: Lytic transglycosylase catalytic, partial [bacterium]
RNYVPAILAIIAIAKQPEAYQVEVKPEASWQFDRVMVTGNTLLTTIADTLALSTDTLYRFNPQLLSSTVPPSSYSLRIPKGIDAKRLALLTTGESQTDYKTRNVVKKKAKGN